MEPAFISMKRGMSRNGKLADVHSDDNLITKCGLAVLCAYLVSTDGILSVPLQLGARLLLSHAAVVCPGMESWNRPLVEDNPGFVEDVRRYVKTIEHYKNLIPVDRKLVRLGEQFTGVVVFHDRSVAALGALIYIMTQDDTGTKHLRIARAGRKCGNHSIPTLEHISRSYALVLLKPLLCVLKNIARSNLSFYFISDSTCSLRLLKLEVGTTNKLSSNSKVQLEQPLLLSN